MKKIIFCFLIVFSLMLFSIDENVKSLVGKVIKFEGDIVLVKEFKIFEENTPLGINKIDVMVFKSFSTGQLEERDIIRVNFLDIIKWDIISDSEEKYLANVKQEKKEQQNSLIEKEKFYENANKSVKGNPFALFMGMPWKTNAADFKKYFKYNLIPFSKGFIIVNFPLGNNNIKNIGFYFKPEEKSLNFKESNYLKYYFDSVLMSIEPNQFEFILDIFTKKYGKPLKIKEYEIQNRMGAKFIQKKVFWKNGNRKIEISRYTSSIDEGIVTFASVGDGKQVQKEREKEIKEASDVL